MPRDDPIDDEFVALLTAMENRARRLASVYANAQDCEDLIQEMRLQLWKSWSSFRRDARPTTWAYRVILNTALMHRRKESRHSVRNQSSNEDLPGGQSDAVQRALLREFILSLRPIDKAVFVLFLEHVTRSEMVEILGLSESAIASRLSRIKSKFRTTYLEVEE